MLGRIQSISAKSKFGNKKFSLIAISYKAVPGNGVIITKFAARVDSPFTILSYQYTIVTLLSFPIALYFWQSPSIETINYLTFPTQSTGKDTHNISKITFVYFAGSIWSSPI